MIYAAFSFTTYPAIITTTPLVHDIKLIFCIPGSNNADCAIQLDRLTGNNTTQVGSSAILKDFS
jgi:hypothetical protein